MKFLIFYFAFGITVLHYAAKNNDVLLIHKLLKFPGIDKYKANNVLNFIFIMISFIFL